jgi:hypothetical protein
MPDQVVDFAIAPFSHLDLFWLGSEEECLVRGAEAPHVGTSVRRVGGAPRVMAYKPAAGLSPAKRLRLMGRTRCRHRQQTLSAGLTPAAPRAEGVL